MVNYSHFRKLANSEREPLKDARCLGKANLEDKIEATIVVRRPSIDHLLEKVGAPYYYKENFVSHETFEKTYCAHPGDIDQIRDFANIYNLEIKDIHSASGMVRILGTIDSLNKAFGVVIEEYEHPDCTYFGHKGPVYLPQELENIVEAVLGLDTRPQIQPHFQLLQNIEPLARAGASNSQNYIPSQVAELYNFPKTNTRAEKPCIGIIELGGGYDEQDLKKYFSGLGIEEPTVTAVSVNGATNQPTGDPNSADGEVMLDIEVVGAVAPGVNIAVYFAPNTDAGFLNAVKTAIHDKKNKPSVLSISWGSAEINWTKQAMKAMDRAFQDASALGVTVCCASGDQGSSDGIQDGHVHVDFPASSPHVLACGGTKLSSSGNTITSEVVWNESSSSSTGGGISEVFSLPAWQKSANVPPSADPSGVIGRGVPDVAGDADPVTGYEILVGGQVYVFGGTSAVAPLWAGLIAIINQNLGHSVGLINPSLYNPMTWCSSLHDITQGNNDTTIQPNAYPAKTGWDACTGLGTPDGTKLLDTLKNLYQVK